MCGRYTLVTPSLALDGWVEPEEMPELAPRYNIAPTEEAPVVRRRGDRREAAVLIWGLVPPWAPDPAIGGRLINARVETAADKPVFREAMRRRRCLVPADGFYEWRREGGARQGYHLHRPGREPFVMAGVWERWGPSEARLETFAVLTRDPSDAVRPFHDRMPLLLDPAAGAAWLDWEGEEPAELVDHLLTLAPPALEATAVGPWVNKAGREGPDCLAPPAQGSLF